MKSHPWQREFDVAVRVVRDAALLARQIQHQTGAQPLLKADASPATIADFAVQAFIAHRLAEAFPDDPLVAEEDAASLRMHGSDALCAAVVDALRHSLLHLKFDDVLTAIDLGCAAPAERFWTLDPIDGTRGFMRGDQYVVALALIVNGRVELAVLGCPRLSLGQRRDEAGGTIACAVRRAGAHWRWLTDGDFMPLHVSACEDPRVARVLRSFEPRHIDQLAFDRLVDDLGVQGTPLLLDSQAKHAWLAAGRADLIIRIPATSSYREKIWDHAAGSLIVEEAGGSVTDLAGDQLDFGSGRWLTCNSGVIASNRRLHPAVLSAWRRVAALKVCVR